MLFCWILVLAPKHNRLKSKIKSFGICSLSIRLTYETRREEGKHNFFPFPYPPVHQFSSCAPPFPPVHPLFPLCTPVISRNDRNDENKQLTLLSQCKLTFTAKNTLFVLKKSLEHQKNTAKHTKAKSISWDSPFKPSSVNFCQNFWNLSHETVPLNIRFFLIRASKPPSKDANTVIQQTCFNLE